VKTTTLLLSALLALVLCGNQAHAEEWRIATLAPAGSTWMRILDRGAVATEKITEGRVKFKYFEGAIQGDDRDVVRKMKLGGLDGGVLTSVGLAMIDKHMGVLQLPRLFRDVEELDYVRRRMWPYFQRRFEKKGYILGAPGDIGWVYFMSKNKITTLEQLRRAKVWRWEGDEVSLALFKKAQLQGVPLGVPDVLPSLMSGRIDSCFGSPLAAMALQWTSKVKYIAEIPTTYAIGGTVIRKDVWERVSEEDRAKMKKLTKKMTRQLRKNVRRDDRVSLRTMIRKGIKVVKADEAMMTEMDRLAEEAWGEMAGKIYSQRELDKVLEYRAAYRKKQAAKTK
jgi:TRAP-type C4-dicarboxylate transport system substrate-binding protein